MSTRLRAAGQRRKVLGKKRPIRRGRVQQRKGNKTFATREMITYMSPQQMPYPQRYRTKFTTAVQFNITAAQQAGQIPIRLNSCNLPFGSSGLGAAPYANALPSVATLQPAGFTAMFTTSQYQKCRVYASSIEINFAALSQSDPMMVTITPSVSGNNPTLTSIALEQPYTKHYLFTANRSRSVLRNYMTAHRLVGATQRAIEDDLSGNHYFSNGGQPGIPTYWVVNWNVVDAANSSSVVICEIKVIHYVELFSNYDAIMAET